jgi:hypothetical protein
MQVGKWIQFVSFFLLEFRAETCKLSLEKKRRICDDGAERGGMENLSTNIQ